MLYLCSAKAWNRGVAQLVSAPRSGRGGRKFESSHPDPKGDNKQSTCKLSLFVVWIYKSCMATDKKRGDISATPLC